MSKIIKRLLLFFAIAFAFLSISIFVILSEPLIQHSIVKYLNTHYLNKNGINLKVGTISYNLFLQKISIENVQFDNIETQSAEQIAFLKVKNLSAKLDFLKSYLNNRVVVEDLSVIGTQVTLDYDELGNLIVPKIFQHKNQTLEKKGKAFLLLDKYIDYIPKQVLITDTNIQVGKTQKNDYHDVYISKVKLLKRKKIFGSDHQLDISTDIQKSQIFFQSFHKPINIKSLKLDGVLHRNGKLDLPNFSLQSDVINIDAKIYSFLQDPLLLSPYEIDLKNAEILSEDLFKILNIPATGKMKINGSLKSIAILEAPQFFGQVEWQNLILDDFNLFTGKSAVQFKNRTLYYDKAVLKTASGGQLFAKGKYEFFDSFYFENYAFGQNISLKELLNSLHAKQNLFEATLDTKDIAVTGHLKNDLKDKTKSTYDIVISAGVTVQNLSLVPLQASRNFYLPKAFVDLHIEITSTGLVFDQTKAHFIAAKTESKGVIEITNSALLLKDKPTFSMELSGSNLDLGFLKYFITKKASGVLSFSSILAYDFANPGIKFQSKIKAVDGKIDGIPFVKASGNFSLFDETGELSDFIFEIPQLSNAPKTTVAPQIVNIRQNTTINLKYFSFRYEDMYAHIIADVQGNLGDFLHALKSKLPNVFNTFDGEIETLNLTLSGYILQPKTWKFDFDLAVQSLMTQKGMLNTLLAHFECAESECKKSKILFDGFEGKRDSSALILLFDVSNEKSNLTFQVQNVPVEFFNYTDIKIAGKLYGTGELQGTWRRPVGDIDLNIDHADINQREIGAVSARYHSVAADLSELQVLAFDNQIALSLMIALGNAQDSRLNIKFSNFDLARLLSEESSLVGILYSQINGQIALSGKWAPDLKTGFSFLKNWSGTGQIEPSDLQFGYANLVLGSSEKFQIKDNKIYADKLRLSSNFISIEIKGYYDLATTQISIDSTAKMDLGNLYKNFYIIAESDGKVNSELHVNGMIANPNISGYVALAAETVTIRSDSTSYTDVEGYMTINNKVLQIQKFNAKKGIGNLSLTGTIDLKKFSESGYPQTNLHLLTRNLELQFPIPIFRNVDMVLNTDLTLRGQKLPLLVTGRVEVQKMSVFRDLTCAEIYAEYKNLPKVDPAVRSTPLLNFNVNVQAYNSISLQSNCLRGRFSTIENLRVVGNSNAPLLEGGIQTENAIFSILKARFNVKNASFVFSEKYKFDPVTDISMNARIASYDIFWTVNGRVSDAKLELSSEPEYFADGSLITQSAILFMITTGQMPTPDTLNTLLATSSGVYSYFGTNNTFSSVIDQTLAAVTGGIFDTLAITPISTNGEVGVGFKASRNFSQRLTFGLSFEGAESQSISSIFLYYLLNKHVNFTAQYSRSVLNSNTAAINDVGAGLRFNFGSY